MPDILPAAILRVYDDLTEAFGRVVSPPQSLTYDLPGLLGTPGASYTGFDKDPTGTYLMQQMVPVFFNAGPSAWQLPSGGSLPSTFSSGLDPQYGCAFLYYQTITDAFNVQLKAARVLDEGFYANFYLGQATATLPAAGSTAAPVVPLVSFYVEFSRGRAAGEPGLRLALEPGKCIRLQVSRDDDKTWTDVATADALGECETYLTQQGRHFSFSVLPMTDASWEAGLPATLAGSGPPPNQIVVSIGGGDAVLTYTDDGLAEGAMAVTGQNRQWSVRPCLMRFSTQGKVMLAPQVRPEPLVTEPTVFLNGSVPESSALSAIAVADSLNSAHVELTLTATADATGYALRSCFLASVDAEFPPLQIAPLPEASYVDYPAIYSEVRHSFDQTTGTVRRVAFLLFSNNDDQFAPGLLVEQAVKAGALFHTSGTGVFPPDAETEEIGGVLYAREMTGYTAMEEDGQGWYYENGLKYFRLTLSDKLVHTEEDTAISAGYQLPYDFQCQYYAFGQQAYRLGICDVWWNFPLVRRGDATPYYYLDGGTAERPQHQFPPDMTLGATMEHIRALGAELDPVSGQPQPMVMGTDSLGFLDFYGLPAGVASCLADPTLVPASVDLRPEIIFSKVPQLNDDGSPVLNEFVETWRTKSSLRRVRTPFVAVGLDPQTGSAIFGIAYNERVGGGPFSDPTARGYIGVNKPLYFINRVISSQAVADLTAQKAAVQLAAPAVDTGGTLHLQPGLDVLTVVGVQDYTTQGTTAPVVYYTTHITSIVDLRGEKHHGTTELSARILGQTD